MQIDAEAPVSDNTLRKEQRASLVEESHPKTAAELGADLGHLILDLEVPAG